MVVIQRPKSGHAITAGVKRGGLPGNTTVGRVEQSPLPQRGRATDPDFIRTNRRDARQTRIKIQGACSHVGYVPSSTVVVRLEDRSVFTCDVDGRTEAAHDSQDAVVEPRQRRPGRTGVFARWRRGSLRARGVLFSDGSPRPADPDRRLFALSSFRRQLRRFSG